MQEPGDANRSTDNAISGSLEQSTQEPQDIIDSYEAIVRDLSKMLNSVSVLNLLEKDISVYQTVDKQLRDAIDNLEAFTDSPEGQGTDMEPVLEALNKAKQALAGVAILEKASDPLVQEKYPERIDLCRAQLRHAANLMRDLLKK